MCVKTWKDAQSELIYCFLHGDTVEDNMEVSFLYSLSESHPAAAAYSIVIRNEWLNYLSVLLFIISFVQVSARDGQ